MNVPATTLENYKLSHPHPLVSFVLPHSTYHHYKYYCILLITCLYQNISYMRAGNYYFVCLFAFFFLQQKTSLGIWWVQSICQMNE